MNLWRKSVSALILALLVTPSGAVVTISHQPIDCIVRNTHAKVEARYTPETVTKKRVFFRAPGTEDFYWVELAGAQTGAVAGFLPKPHPTTASIEYYVEGAVSETDRGETERFAPVVSTMTFCQNEAKNFSQPADNERVSIVLGLVRWGQAAVPQGFLPSNIVSVVLPNGATASLTEAMKAGGTQQGAAGQAASAGASSGSAGGLSTWAIVGGAAGAAGIAVAVGGGGGGNDSAVDPVPGPTLPPTCSGVTESTFYNSCGNVLASSVPADVLLYVRIRTGSCECLTVNCRSLVVSPVSSCSFGLGGADLSFSGCGVSRSSPVTSCGSDPVQTPGGGTFAGSTVRASDLALSTAKEVSGACQSWSGSSEFIPCPGSTGQIEVILDEIRES